MFNRFFNTALSAAIAIGIMSSGGLVWAAGPIKTEAEYQAELKQVDAKLLAKPDDPGALYRHALIMSRLKRFDDAVTEGAKLTSRYPTWKDAYMVQVVGQMNLEHNSDALKLLNRIIELGSPSAEVQLMKARLLLKGKKYLEVIALASRVIEQDPNNGDAYDCRASAYLGLKGPSEQGISDLEQVVRINPDDLDAKSMIKKLKLLRASAK